MEEELIQELEKLRGKRKIKEIREKANQLLNAGIQQNNFDYQIVSYFHIGYYYFWKGDYKNALEFCMKGLNICNIHTLKKYHVLLCNLVGVIYGAFTDVSNSLSYFLKAYYLSYNDPEANYNYMILNNIGNTFNDLGYYEKSLEYFLQCFDERKLTLENMNIRDGVYICNIIGAYAKMQRFDEVQPWIDIYEAFKKRFHDKVSEGDYHLYCVYIAKHRNEEGSLKSAVNQMIVDAKDITNPLQSFKNLMEAMDICIDFGNQELCELILSEMQRIHANYYDYKNEVQLNKRKVKMYKKFNDEDNLKTSLLDYYESKQKEYECNKNTIKNGMVMKIELEKLLYDQKQILRKNEELLQNNKLDEFTKVYNKTNFIKYVENELESLSSNGYCAFLVLDVDNFKAVNDVYGHLIGDKVLLKVAETLKNHIQDNGYIGRIGGDEFCIFIRNIQNEEFLCKDVNNLITVISSLQIDKSIHITVSIGVYIINEKEGYEEVFKKADHAMYKAKQNGRNRYFLVK